jgi:hypothetical protein
MHSVDSEVLSKALSWLQAGEQVTLATLVKTVGSAPRPLGALLAVRGDGALAVKPALLASQHFYSLPAQKRNGGRERHG